MCTWHQHLHDVGEILPGSSVSEVVKWQRGCHLPPVAKTYPLTELSGMDALVKSQVLRAASCPLPLPVPLTLIWPCTPGLLSLAWLPGLQTQVLSEDWKELQDQLFLNTYICVVRRMILASVSPHPQ